MVAIFSATPNGMIRYKLTLVLPCRLRNLLEACTEPYGLKKGTKNTGLVEASPSTLESTTPASGESFLVMRDV